MPLKYRTKQRACIMDVLAQNCDRHLSADEIWKLLSSGETAVSRATIYRSLDKLVESGEVTRYIGGDGESACYQLSQENCHHHYHFKCIACGKLLHVECEHLDTMESHITNEHEFIIDPARTVFYGLCGDCTRSRNK